jgi:hypothetical protein
MNFLIGLAIVAVGWWLVRSFARSTPQQSRALSNKLAGYGLLVFAALVALRGHFEYAVPVAAVALGMLGYQHAFGLKKPVAGNEAPRDAPPARGKIRMSRDEALRVLGLPVSASAEDIRAAHKRLLKDFHPDKGGSDYLAAQINEAKETLLRA